MQQLAGHGVKASGCMCVSYFSVFQLEFEPQSSEKAQLCPHSSPKIPLRRQDSEVPTWGFRPSRPSYPDFSMKVSLGWK